MKRLLILLPALALGASGCAGCGVNANQGGDGGPRDLTFVFPMTDASEDGGNACGDNDPSCMQVSFGPDRGRTFPLPADMPKDPNVGADGVSRDKNGWLTLDSNRASFDFLWVANSEDWSAGTVSKFNSKTIREVARYYTVTCHSLKTGGKGNCDGQSGCCANDSYPQWQARKNNKPPAPAQQVQLDSNAPSRTAVDFSGDMWIANRAFGGQSSVTKIANDPLSCVDRNGNGKIDTSSDVNGNGVIEVDCNENGTPDDIDDVKVVKCTNNLAQEFYGLDDECVLFTTNTNDQNQLGRPLGLGPGANDTGPSDAWAGTYEDGKFFRIDGTTGLTKEEVQLPNACQPYGLVVDSSAIGWAGNLSSEPLCFFNTKNPQEVGTARPPLVGQQEGYGIALDRDQNVWLGCLGFGVCRYTPVRGKAFADLGKGYWTMIQNPGGNAGAGYSIGIAVDSRTANSYFAWTAGDSHLVRIPASALPLPNGMDQLVDGAAYPAVQIAGDGKGVGVDRDQNVWNISGSGQTGATRVKVDANGVMTPPDIVSPPMGMNLCPAGDRCPHQGNNMSDPSPYTYSDFTGFGLRNFTRPSGFYSYIQKGCSDGKGPADTRWIRVDWDADVPLNTAITFKARSGKTPTPDMTWGAWSPAFKLSPADLITGMPLIPNVKDSSYLQVQFDFGTTDKTAVPKLKSFDLFYSCPGGIG